MLHTPAGLPCYFRCLLFICRHAVDAADAGELMMPAMLIRAPRRELAAMLLR